MRTDPQSGIALIGDQLSRAVEAEHASDGSFVDRLATIMAEAMDRTSSSDELATHLVDWQTRLHLSRMRANILRPLHIRPGDRVLDLGAGTGALSRYLGEVGAEVVALEPNLDHARIAQARCSGLPGVEVVSGPVGSFDDDDGFDIVLLAGVLEHSAALMGGEGSQSGESGAQAMLDAAARLTRPSGAVVLAIDNQLGLRYLLGHPEDNIGRAWVGVEGYSSSSDFRTWTRRELGDLLGGAGLAEQRWLYPFPDYKLATTVIADRAYDEPDAARLVDQLLGAPVRVNEAPSDVRVDARRVNQTFLAAGAGRDVSNSFVVVASADGSAPDRLVASDVLAWRLGAERRRIWLRTTTVTADVDGGGRIARQARQQPDEGRPEAGWVSQSVAPERPYRTGPTVEQEFLEAASARDEEQMSAVLQRWRDCLRAQERPRDDQRAVHPYLDRDADRVLPASWLDVNLDNFVDEDGDLHFIDDEWTVPEGVSPELATTRALWWLALSIVVNDIDHPWSATLDVDSLAISIGRLAGEGIDQARLEAFRSAEAQFQALVDGSDSDDVLADLVHHGALSSFSLGMQKQHAVGVLARVGRELGEAQTLAETLKPRRQQLEDLEAKSALLDEMADKLHHALRELHNEKLKHEQLIETVDRIRRRFPVRAYLKVKRLVSGRF